MGPDQVVIDYFNDLIKNQKPDWRFFTKEPNFIMKKIYNYGAKHFKEIIGAELIKENDKKAKVLYAIENSKGNVYRFVCTLKKVDGLWKIKTFDNYDLG